MISTLPQMLYLLDGDSERQEVCPSASRGLLMRAAALAELSRMGLLKDQDGRAVPTEVKASIDTFLGQVLTDASAGKPRNWSTLVQSNAYAAENSVRTQLAAAGDIEVEKSTPLGYLASLRVFVRRPGKVFALREKARIEVLSEHAPATVLDDGVITAVLAAEGGVTSTITISERFRYGARIQLLADRFDSVIPGVRKALRRSIAAVESDAAVCCWTRH